MLAEARSRPRALLLPLFFTPLFFTLLLAPLCAAAQIPQASSGKITVAAAAKPAPNAHPARKAVSKKRVARKPALKPKPKAVKRKPVKKKPVHKPIPKPRPKPAPMRPAPAAQAPAKPAPAVPQSQAPAFRSEAPKLLLAPAEAEARYREAVSLEHAGDPRGAFKAYEEAAESGHALAQKKLGDLYGTGGEAVKRDYETSLRWYSKAREQGIQVPKPFTYPGVRR